MGVGIQEGQSLSLMEKKIMHAVQGREFWGDLELSFDEVEILKERLKDILSTEQVFIDNLCKMYPYSITTYMVFFIRYRYNINFWGVLSEKLDVTLDD